MKSAARHSSRSHARGSTSTRKQGRVRIVLATTLVLSLGVSFTLHKGGADLLSRSSQRSLLPHLATSASRAHVKNFSSTQVHFQVVLQPQSPKRLEAFDAGVSTPTSPSYRRFLSSRSFGRHFGASNSTLRVVRGYFRGFGLTPGKLWPGHLVIDVSGSVNQASQALNVSFYPDKIGNRGYFPQATATASLPPFIAKDVVGVIGIFPNGNTPLGGNRIAPTPRLTNDMHRKQRVVPHLSSPGLRGAQACPVARSQAANLGAYLPTQIARTYAMTSLYAKGDRGQGVTVAMPEFTDLLNSSPVPSPFQRDLTQFLRCFNIPGEVSFRPIDGGSANHTVANLEEAELDIETFLSLAPDAQVTLYTATQGNSDEMFLHMVADNKASIVVTSWGSCEAVTAGLDISVERLGLEEAAAQGQSVIAAAGDDGSADCWPEGRNGALAVDDPSSQPMVTSVGGVQYSSPLSTGSIPSVWNDTTYSGGGGGGVSSLWGSPPFQHAVATNDPEAVANCRRPAGCRLVPDVSMLAEGFLVKTPHYGWDVLGGTSGAAPVFAAGMALVEGKLHHRMGDLNPLLYYLYRHHKSIYTDVTRGNNDYHDRHHGLFHALVGYDVASGLGTVNFARVLGALTSRAS